MKLLILLITQSNYQSLIVEFLPELVVAITFYLIKENLPEFQLWLLS